MMRTGRRRKMISKIVAKAEVFHKGVRFSPFTLHARLSELFVLNEGMPALALEWYRNKFNSYPQYEEEIDTPHIRPHVSFLYDDEQKGLYDVPFEVNTDENYFKIGVGKIDF